SGAYTTAEATALLPKTIARSRAVDPRSALVAGWKNPTHGFRVHVTANHKIETVNFFGTKKSGMDGLTSALELSESMQYGNPLSVLLTSDTDGWQTDTKRQILKRLFKPSIQLYIVTAASSLPPGIARAWKDAGAQVGWMRMESGFRGDHGVFIAADKAPA